jgi:non-lysosomal glucosylceramidase
VLISKNLSFQVLQDLPASNILKDETKKESHYPPIAWTRTLSQQFPKIEEFSVTVREGAKLAMLGYRMWKYVRREKSAGRVPIMDPFNTPTIEPLMGVPLGGIGGGSITRGWRGDFIR